MRLLKRVSLGLLLLLVLIQGVPYGCSHTNPPGRAEPKWPSPRVRELAVRACFDCHSNETPWPWYSHVAPMSWLVQRDVDRARQRLNFSAWDRPQRKVGDAAEELEQGEMPPWYYLPMHAQARLNDTEKAELVAGLKVVAGSATRSEPGRGSGDSDREDDDDR